MQVMTSQAVIAFFSRCSISRRIVDLTAARAVNALAVRLTDSAWSRILTELLSAQVFARPANSLDDLHASMRDACFPTPARLEIVADDWHHVEAFAVPAEIDAAAVTARQQLEPIQFLSLVNALDVEEPMAPFPLSLFSIIVALVGSFRTQATLRMGAPSVRLSASAFRAHFTSTACTDAQLAAEVASFVERSMFPHQVRNFGASEDERCKDLKGGFNHLSSSWGGRSVEGERVQLLEAGLDAAATMPRDGRQADAACRGPDPNARAFEEKHAHLFLDRCAVHFNLGSHPLHAAVAL